MLEPVFKFPSSTLYTEVSSLWSIAISFLFYTIHGQINAPQALVIFSDFVFPLLQMATRGQSGRKYTMNYTRELYSTEIRPFIYIKWRGCREIVTGMKQGELGLPGKGS